MPHTGSAETNLGRGARHVLESSPGWFSFSPLVESLGYKYFKIIGNKKGGLIKISLHLLMRYCLGHCPHMPQPFHRKLEVKIPNAFSHSSSVQFCSQEKQYTFYCFFPCLSLQPSGFSRTKVWFSCKALVDWISTFQFFLIQQEFIKPLLCTKLLRGTENASDDPDSLSWCSPGWGRWEARKQ